MRKYFSIVRSIGKLKHLSHVGESIPATENIQREDDGESNMQIASKLPSDAVILLVHETCKGIFEKYQGKLQNSIIERSMAISK